MIKFRLEYTSSSFFTKLFTSDPDIIGSGRRRPVTGVSAAPPNKLKSSEADEPDIPAIRLPTLVGWVTLLNHNYTRVPELELMSGSTEVNCVSHTVGPRAVSRASVKWIATRPRVFTENMSSSAAAAVVLQLALAVFLLLDTSFAQGELSLSLLIYFVRKGFNFLITHA